MAEIATYTCSNRECRLTVRLAHDFPVWDDLRTTVTRHRSEAFCASCNKITEYTAAHACAVCGSAVAVELLSTACYRCKAGTFAMPKLSVL